MAQVLEVGVVLLSGGWLRHDHQVLKLAAHRIEAVHHIARLHATPAEPVQQQPQFHLHHVHGKAKLLPEYNAGQVCLIHLGSDDNQLDRLADPVEIAGQLLQIAAR